MLHKIDGSVRGDIGGGGGGDAVSLGVNLAMIGLMFNHISSR